MSRLALLAIVVLGVTACVADDGPSYYRDGYYDGYRAPYYDRSGTYNRSRARALYEDRHLVNDYNRPGP